MVGAINPPSSGSNTFSAFQNNARQFQGTPDQAEGALVGMGASASTGPGPAVSGASFYPAPSATTTSASSGSNSGNNSSSSGGSSGGSSTTPNGSLTMTANLLVVTLGMILGSYLCIA
ncbi:hypothetical protein C0992_005348 [Termitomyces sp. T32_za158]|nr:hypothetical protein C0992_005348 [Termitomyces sp. T32_za158]